MRICRHCNSKIDDDALVCPYCGCVVKKGKKEKEVSNESPVTENNTLAPKKKRKTWLWVLGWLCIFPVPLTILMLRNQKMKKNTRYAVIAIAWIIYLIIGVAGGSKDSSTTNQIGTTEEIAGESVDAEETGDNIKSLSFENTDDVTVKVGKTCSPRCLQVDVKSKKDFSADNIEFISENPEIATITLAKEFSTTLYCEIAGVGAGETNVCATSKDGSVKSESIHVIVPEPIGVDAIELQGYKTDLCVSQTTSAITTISPSDAEDKTLTWTSSDEAVATVDEQGNVTAVGGGTATISATANSGVAASFDVNVDGTKTLMKLNVTHPRDDDVDIGDDWSYDIQVNGDSVYNEMGVAVGEKLNFYAQFTESDKKPDVGSAKTTHTVTEEDITNGFDVTMDVYVTENGGRNSGKSAHFIVTYTFSPI